MGSSLSSATSTAQSHSGDVSHKKTMQEEKCCSSKVQSIPEVQTDENSLLEDQDSSGVMISDTMSSSTSTEGEVQFDDCLEEVPGPLTNHFDQISLEEVSASAVNTSITEGLVEDINCTVGREEELAKINGLLNNESKSNSGDDRSVEVMEAASPPSSVNHDQTVSSDLKKFSSLDLVYGGFIGEGDFGKVSKAILKAKSPRQVAVKVLHAHFDSVTTTTQLQRLYNLKHGNVVDIIGIVAPPAATDSVNPPTVFGPRFIIEYFPQGNILEFLSRRSGELEQTTLVKLLLDASHGCEYLHSQGIVHGNLAARNILIERQFDSTKTEAQYNAKVSDYGIIQLAKVKGVNSCVKAKNGMVVSLRHSPAELFAPDNKGFTFQSDVWSFGVLLWEVFTRGATPYGKKKEDSNVMRYIEYGLSPDAFRPPQGYSLQLINIMKATFKLNPEQRPTFPEISQRLSVELSNVASQIPIPQNTADGDTEDGVSPGFHSRRVKSGRDVNKLENYRRHLPTRRRGQRSSLSRGRKAPTQEPAANQSVPVESQSEDTEQRQRPSAVNGGNGDLRELLLAKRSQRSELPPRPAHKYDSTSELPPTFASAMADQPNEGLVTSLGGPPPPYTSTLTPKHATVRTGPRRSNSSAFQYPRTVPSPTVDYDKEIERKTQELERLKVQKLQQEASETWNKMQSIFSQLSQISPSPGSPELSAGRSYHSSTDSPRRDYEADSSSYNNKASPAAGSFRGSGRGSRRGRGASCARPKFSSRR